MKIRLILLLSLIVIAQTTLAEANVQIIKVKGDVKIRRGMEENWQPASAGTWLDEIDTILTGEAAEATLAIKDGKLFTLGSNAALDVADLRQITERELFLYLMSKKIDQIGPRQDKTKLRIGNVNVVHGEYRSGENIVDKDGSENWIYEKNGAYALYKNALATNAILKLNKILLKYPDLNDCGEIHFYLGQAFETLDKPGQALDAYKMILQRNDLEGCDNSPQWYKQATAALQRLNQ